MNRAGGNVAMLVGSVAICLALLITVLVSARDQPDEEVRDILCAYERRAHEAWQLGGEVGKEPSLRECE